MTCGGNDTRGGDGPRPRADSDTQGVMTAITTGAGAGGLRAGAPQRVLPGGPGGYWSWCAIAWRFVTLALTGKCARPGTTGRSGMVSLLVSQLWQTGTW